MTAFRSRAELNDRTEASPCYRQVEDDYRLSRDWAIAACNVEMVYRSGDREVHALKSVDFGVRRGEIQLLMGPSGSGKTTLLSILAGILTPTSGQVSLLGQEITRMSRRRLAKFRRQNIGFVFQGFNLFPALTAAENIQVALNLKGIHGKVARHLSERLLEDVGLQDKAAFLPKDLSGGQKQRIAIARALVDNPPLILADEPTAALDARSGRNAVELLRRLAKERGSTVVIVTHDSRILDLADRIAYVEDGVISDRPDFEAS